MTATDSRERSPCVPDETFERLFTGDVIDDRELSEIDRHANECEECADRLADVGFRRGDSARAAAGAPTVRRVPVEVGDVLDDKYRVEALLGSGGMGTVVRACHVGENKKVALKLMRPERVADGISVVRLLREARAAGALASRHAVRILDVGRTKSEAPYLVMEYLAGRDLARVVAAEGPLEPLRAIDYMLQSLDAVAEAHSRGIIHRDLKPQNLFLTEDGVIKVLDFGLAKLVPLLGSKHGDERDSQATRTNVLLGSPRYMSPEQIATPREIDHRSDIWSLGATLFHLLSGGPPFRDTNLLVLATKIFGEPAPRLREVRPDVPQCLDDVVARCLQRAREDRFEDAIAFGRALERAYAEIDPTGPKRTLPRADEAIRASNTQPAPPPVASDAPEDEATQLMDVVPKVYEEDEERKASGKGGTVVMDARPPSDVRVSAPQPRSSERTAKQAPPRGDSGAREAGRRPAPQKKPAPSKPKPRPAPSHPELPPAPPPRESAGPAVIVVVAALLVILASFAVYQYLR
jgi:serine/threonine-protein kinase